VTSTPISGATFTIDNSAPTVVSTTPPNGSSGVAVDTPITATFSEAIDPSSLNNSTFTVSGVTGTVSYDPSGSTATFIPNIPLAYSTSYTAMVIGVKDPAGNTMAAGQSWTFTTEPMPDKTPPTAVIDYSPAGPYKVGTTITITATFSEALADSPVPMISLSGAATLTAVNMTKTDATHYTYDYTVGTGTGNVTVTLSAGTDSAGNAVLATPISGATFTIDNAAPTVISTNPANMDDKADVTSTIAAIFSEAINPATISFTVSGVTGTVSYNETTYTATFIPDKALSYGTKYTAAVTGAKDLAGNIMAADKTWTFTTTAVPDTTPPAIISITPADGEKGVDVKSVLTVQFSETVNLGDSSFSVNGVTGSTEYVDSTHTAYFIPSGGLSYYTTYTATVTGVKDLAGNAMAADKTWTFTTAPHYGDLTGNGGDPDINDARIALYIVTGIITNPTPQQLASCDVAPLVNGKPNPNPKGYVDLGDVIAILRRVTGLTAW
jgi:methionine-rich copper-binding protein CopC